MSADDLDLDSAHVGDGYEFSAETGKAVDYHGSKVDERGRGIVMGACQCPTCFTKTPGVGDRLVISTVNGRALWHVRRASVTILAA